MSESQRRQQSHENCWHAVHLTAPPHWHPAQLPIPRRSIIYYEPGVADMDISHFMQDVSYRRTLVVHLISNASAGVPSWFSRLRIWHCLCRGSDQVTTAARVQSPAQELLHALGVAQKNACGKLGIKYDSDTFCKLMSSLVKEIIGPWFIFWVDLRLPTLSICPKWGIHHN